MMIRHWMSAGLMSATIMGGVPATAYAAAPDREGQRWGDRRGGGDRVSPNRANNARWNTTRNENRVERPSAPVMRAPAAESRPQRVERVERRDVRQDQRQVRREDRQQWRQERQVDRQDRRVERRVERPNTRAEWRENRRENRTDWREDRRDQRRADNGAVIRQNDAWRRDRDRDGDRDRNWNRDRRDDVRDRDRANRSKNEWLANRDRHYRHSDRDHRWAKQRYNWDSHWRNDRRYDWRDYRSKYRDRYRHRYYAPRGWGYGYRPFSIGISLWSGLYSSHYWINDPYYYRLPPAYGSLRWVRYYDDALLVDIRTGYVVDVIYDFFW